MLGLVVLAKYKIKEFNLFLIFQSLVGILFYSSLVLAEDLSSDYQLQYAQSDLDLGSEYSDYNKEKYKRDSHGKIIGKNSNSRSPNHDTAVSVLLFIPNRILDILDILRFDIGVGPSVGGVVRITPYGQAGVRFLMPVSIRAGLRGRRLPVFLEHANEMGIGPAFLSSEAREPSILEVGAGVDLFVAGVYAGISFDSIWDALAGFIGWIQPKMTSKN